MAWRGNIIPRPTKFLHFISLRTGTSLILLLHLINKVTAVYGILAIFTSFPLSGLQLSMYIYSVPVLLATIYIAGPLRSQSAWHTLAFAYIYGLDTIVNAIYTAVFGVTWFLVLAADDGRGSTSAPGGSMMQDTSGFANPELNVSQVEVVAQPKPGLNPGQDAVAVASGSNTGSGTGLAAAVFNGSSMMSIFIICGFWLLRMYAVFVVMAYARQTLRHHIQATSLQNLDGWSSKGEDDMADNPFAESRPQGQGLKGKLGRFMVRIGKTYWLGRDGPEMDFDLRHITPKLRRSEDSSTGTLERERRRRSGTGPPAPPPGLVGSPV